MLLPSEANRDAMTAMAARLMLGKPTAPAKTSPSPHAAMPNARAREMLSTVGTAATTAAVVLVAAVEAAALALLASRDRSPAVCAA